MWIKLKQAIALFYPSEVLPVGAVASIGDPKGRKLVQAGKAVKVAFPPSADPDDVNSLRDKYRESNGPLWDEKPRSTPPAAPAAGFGARIFPENNSDAPAPLPQPAPVPDQKPVSDYAKRLRLKRRPRSKSE